MHENFFIELDFFIVFLNRQLWSRKPETLAYETNLNKM